MSMQPVGYNLPTHANVTVHNDFPYPLQLSDTAVESCKFWARLAAGSHALSNDAYEGLTGRLHEVMHHRSHQAEY